MVAFKLYPRTRKSAHGRQLRWFMARYRIALEDGTTKWKTKDVPVDQTTEVDAKRWMIGYLGGQDDATAGATRRTKKHAATIRLLADDWLKKVKAECDPQVFRQRDSHMRKWILSDPVIADLDLERDAYPDVFLEWVRRIDRAPHTVRNVVSTVRKFFDDAKFNRWIARGTENPLGEKGFRDRCPAGVPLAGVDVVVALSREQVAALLTCRDPRIPPHRRVRNIIALATGLRDAELQGATWRDVWLDNPSAPAMDVQRQTIRKGPPTIQMRLANKPFFDDGIRAVGKPPKRDSYRTIPLHRVAARALEWWKTTGWRRWAGRDPQPDDAVFCDHQGHYFRPDSADRLREDLARAGVPSAHPSGALFTAHAMRRTFASLLEDEIVPREHTAALLGHKQKGVAARHYIAKMPRPMREAIQKLPLPEGAVFHL